MYTRAVTQPGAHRATAAGMFADIRVVTLAFGQLPPI
jgi:hypothetical protein